MKRTRYLFVKAAILSILFSNCKVVNNGYVIDNDIYLKMKISPCSDTTEMQTLSTSTFSYNVDSYIIANSGYDYGLKNLRIAHIKSIDITINNATTQNNFSVLKKIRFSAFTNIDTLKAFALYPMIDSEVIRDTFSTVQNLFGVSDNLDMYLRNGNNLSPSIVIFNCNIKGKLRRPISDTISCTAHIYYQLVTSKMN